MATAVQISVEVPESLADFRLPEAVQRRLQALLDRQDSVGALTQEEREEAEGLVDLAELMTLLRLRSTRAHSPTPLAP